jgi:hypothetical protein
MKAIKNVTFVILLCISYNSIAMAQNLGSIPIAQRDSLLISIAKEVVLTYGPDYYREYREPIIERGQMPPRGELNPDGRNARRYFYIITFLYDPMEEALEWGFAAEVAVWEDTGQPARVSFGNGFGLGLPENRLRNTSEVIETIPYQRATIRTIWDLDNPDPNQEPLNRDELIRGGYTRGSDGQWSRDRSRPDAPPAEAQRVIRRAQEEMRQRQVERDRSSNNNNSNSRR